MSYIEQNLATKEQIVHRAFVSNGYIFLRPFLPVVAGIIIGLVAGGGAGAFMVGIISFFLLSLPMVIGGFIMKATTEIALTNQRVILKWGLVRRQTIETYLDKVEGINADQGILGRMFGYGSIAIRGTGGGGTPCPGIANPQEFRRAVNEYIQNSRLTPV